MVVVMYPEEDLTLHLATNITLKREEKNLRNKEK
jgi:hypothetical protein